jgi:hypothetical protein
MDGMAQQRYFRKLWSSLMVFNMGHPDIDLFDTPHAANFVSGVHHARLPLAGRPRDR